MPTSSSRKTDALTVAIAASIAYLCVSFGLFVYWPAVQAGIAAGFVAGLLGKRVIDSVVAAGVAVLLVSLAYPSWSLDTAAGFASRLSTAALIALATAATTAAVVALVSRTRGAQRDKLIWALAAAAVALLVANLWASTIEVNGTQFGMASVFERLQQNPVPETYEGDDQLYLRIFYLTHDGVGYYDAVRLAWSGHIGYGELPFATFSYRMPTLFWLWQALPGDGMWLTYGLLALASVGVCATVFIAGQLGRVGLGVLGACAVSAHYLFATTSLYVTFVEPWATSIALVAIAFYVRATRTHSMRWMWAAAATAALAALVREHLVYLIVAAVVTTWALNPKGARWRGMLPWLSALGAVALGVALHVTAVGGQVDSASTVQKWFQGSPAHLASTLAFARAFLNAQPWFQLALVALGLLGCLAIYRAGIRKPGLLLGLAIAGPLVAFVFFGNGTIDAVTGRPDGYWGLMVLPIAFASMPLAFGWLPGMLRRPAH